MLRSVLIGMVLVGVPAAVAESTQSPMRPVPSLHEAVVSPFTNAQLTLEQRLVTLHDRVFEYMNGNVIRADQYFASDDFISLQGDSVFELGLSVQFNDNAQEFKFTPSFAARLALPNTEKRLHIVIDNLNPEALPGSDATEREGDFGVGLRGYLVNTPVSSLHLGGGVKFRGGAPVGYGRSALEKTIPLGAWLADLEQQAFWFSDDGFGEMSQAIFRREFTPNVPFRLVTAGKWTETTWGFEMSQTFQLGYVFKRETELTPEEGFAFRTIFFAHKNGTMLMDKYRLNTTYRRRIYNKWLYLEITPQFDFPRNEDWQAMFSIEFAFDILFFRE